MTAIDPDPPALGAGAFSGQIVYPHWLTACVTVNVWPAIVRLAVRAVVPPLADALNRMTPLPLPVAADVTVSHAALLVGAHAHPIGAVTVTDPDPPDAVSV
jgi:hypothetical protein